MRHIRQVAPAPFTFDKHKTKAAILAAVGKTGSSPAELKRERKLFVKSLPSRFRLALDGNNLHDTSTKGITHMTHLPPLAELDTDGAIQETAEKVNPETRSAFLKKAG
ncbi:MAG: hypothetical protein M3R12_02025, partial [Actinomycetota bacterium]|nr:hypothetical protein [Actinomycetota bacterium]